MHALPSQAHRLGRTAVESGGSMNTCLDFRDSQRQGNQEKVIERKKQYLPECLFQNQATVISIGGDCVRHLMTRSSPGPIQYPGKSFQSNLLRLLQRPPIASRLES